MFADVKENEYKKMYNKKIVQFVLNDCLILGNLCKRLYVKKNKKTPLSAANTQRRKGKTFCQKHTDRYDCALLL